MTEFSITYPSLKIEADTAEEAVEKAKAIWQKVKLEALPVSEIVEALNFYAEPDTYFAMFIYPDRPAGLFADDVGCCIGPHGDHDHRHGRLARQALGNEWWGTEPCDDMKKQIEKEESDGG